MNLKLKPIQPLKDQFPPFGIVLCGGGAAGRWQAGVLVALAQSGVLEQAKVIVGTSVGGLNAGLFAMYGNTLPNEDVEEIGPRPPDPYYKAIEVWESIKKNSDIYTGSLDFWGKIGAGIGFFTGAESILDNSGLHKLIDKVFKSCTMKEASLLLNTHIVISTLCLNLQKEEFFCSFDEKTENVKIADVLKATSAIPGLFKSVPIKLNDKVFWYVDGGVGANNPFIALSKYNDAFPNDKIKKAIVIFCYPDYDEDNAIKLCSKEKTYKSFREALFGTASAILKAQEQIAEMLIIDKVKYSDWNVLALWPKYTPCDSLDFTKTTILQDGYDYATIGMGWDYKYNCNIHILDFLRR